MRKKTVFGILIASALVLLCIGGVASADDSATQTDMLFSGEQPPELPDGEEPPQGDGTQPPELPDGEEPPQGDGTQPPELPDGEEPPAGDGTQPPELPDGEQSINQTSATSPFPLMGILAGLGAAGFVMIRSRK